MGRDRTRGRRSPGPADAADQADASAAPSPRVGVAFPGQGVDPTDVARVLEEHRAHPLVGQLRAIVDSDDWSSLDLNDTRIGQPCVYSASMLSVGAAGDRIPSGSDEVLAFGHSLGEIGAAAFAGACSVEAGLELVTRRAALGFEVNQHRPGLMIVVMRLREHEVEWVRRTVADEQRSVLELGVVNGTGQFVLSGDAAAATRALDVIADLGGVGRALPIGGAYHSPVMAEIVTPYREALQATLTAEPRCPVISCTTGEVLRTRNDLVDALARALVLPVRWVDALQGAVAAGAVEAIDVGPSRTLANLARFSPVLPFRSLRPD